MRSRIKSELSGRLLRKRFSMKILKETVSRKRNMMQPNLRLSVRTSVICLTRDRSLSGNI